eukprot:m.383099 g.383099  ORF g.383099 m.383099 type:complete len:179 (+) comp20045_c7_seq66:4703-5239(+)
MASVEARMGEQDKGAGVSDGGSLTAFATLPPIATPSTPTRRPRSSGGAPNTVEALAATMHVVATASDRDGDGCTPQAVSQVLADLGTSHDSSFGLLQQLTKEVVRVHQQVEQDTQAAIQQGNTFKQRARDIISSKLSRNMKKREHWWQGSWDGWMAARGGPWVTQLAGVRLCLLSTHL